MPAITLKGVPATLHRRLKASAKANKRSLNQELILLLERALSQEHRIDTRAMLEEERRFRSTLKGPFSPLDIDRFKREGRS
jgi:hypothetical protein